MVALGQVTDLTALDVEDVDVPVARKHELPAVGRPVAELRHSARLDVDELAYAAAEPPKA